MKEEVYIVKDRNDKTISLPVNESDKVNIIVEHTSNHSKLKQIERLKKYCVELH